MCGLIDRGRAIERQIDEHANDEESMISLC